MTREEILAALDKKYEAMGQDADTHLKGLLYGEPMTYWDFIQLDALLGLQTQRTQLPDEMVFIVYHQINELFFKLILWEMKQISEEEHIKPDTFVMRLMRISRYFDSLSNSFHIMGDGMEISQYMKFRDTLTPASGFQSMQYRKIEYGSTELINLIDARFRYTIDRETMYENAWENMYWQVAGMDRKRGKGFKNKLMVNFEAKYKEELTDWMLKYKEVNLWSKFKELPQAYKENKALINAMRHYDHTVNIKWVMHHYNAAAKYLDSGKKKAEATGGSDWHKYMHPKYQRRMFFPDLWSKEELDNWGITNLEGCEIIS